MFGLVSGEGDQDNPAFTILGNKLKLNVPADFEIKSTYNIRIAGIDVDGQRYDTALKISVIDDESDNRFNPKDGLVAWYPFDGDAKDKSETIDMVIPVRSSFKSGVLGERSVKGE